MRYNWRASLKKLEDSKFLKDSKFYSVFPSSVIGHIFACVCEVQLRLCVNKTRDDSVSHSQTIFLWSLKLHGNII